jgi:hypothetical protein
MPKNKVSDPITDQEMAFARLVLSGAMTDRQAAEAAGLNPDSAAYIKSKPSVHAYMLEHRAAVEEKLVQQEADGLHQFKLDREQVLKRLWELANLCPEKTRGSITGQVKAMSMIVAMLNLIPDRRVAVPEKKSPAAPVPQINATACPAGQQATTTQPQPAPSPAEEASPGPGPNQSASPSQAQPKWPYPSLFTSIPDLGISFPIKKTPLNPFVRPR